MSPGALLDTDILSAVMRRRQPALGRAQAYLTDHPHFTLRKRAA